MFMLRRKKIWYKTMGFSKNPFDTMPRINELKGVDSLLQEIVYHIQAGNIFVIEGKEGKGKTSILLNTINQFNGIKKLMYINCETLHRHENITSIIKKRNGFWNRLLGKKPKQIILLLDNTTKLSKKNFNRLKYYFDQDYIRSLVITTENYKETRISDSLKERIGKRIVRIPNLNENDAIEIISNRIGDSKILNENILRKIFKHNNSSVKILLQNCEKVAISANEDDRLNIKMKDLNILKEDKQK